MESQSPAAKEAYMAAYTNKLEEEGAGAVEGTDRNGIKLGRWAVGLFGCFGDCIPNGCMAFLCPGVSVAQISARLGLARYSLVLGGFVALYLLAFLALLSETGVLDFLYVTAAVSAALGVARLRTKTRTLFSIPGNILQDVASAIVCGPCAIAQMASHVEAYHPGTCSFRARSTLEGYVRQ